MEKKNVHLVNHIRHLVLKGNSNYWENAKRGAHVLIADKGKFYKKAKRAPFSKKRYDFLHHSDVNRFEIPVSLYDEKQGEKEGHLLVGMKDDRSWFQIERYSGIQSRTIGLHLLNGIQYWTRPRAVRVNIGPYGESFQTEENDPILV